MMAKFTTWRRIKLAADCEGEDEEKLLENKQQPAEDIGEKGESS